MQQLDLDASKQISEDVPHSSYSKPPVGRVAGKVVLVTGAASGQGAAEAAALSREGATVIAADIQDPLRPPPPGVTFHRLDVADRDGWARLAEQLQRKHGQVDGLVNNAARPSLFRLLDVGVEEFETTLRVNLTGALMGMQAIVPLMQGGGSIVNVCSIAALDAHFTTAYTASKWALRGLSRVASLELGPRAIRVNAIFPGLVDTPMVRSAPPVIREVQLEQIPLGRAARPEDVAPAIIFLISDESSWVTGAELAIDGGASAHGGSKPFSDRMRSFSRANQFTLGGDHGSTITR